MRNCFFILLCCLMYGCSSDENDINNNNNSGEQTDDKKIIVMSISDETEDADLLMLCNDGSYMLCDVNNGNGYGTVYVNSSVKNEMEDGFALFIDKDGMPVMGKSKDGTLLFKNITDSSFDFAYIDKRGEISYYWDIPFDGGSANIKTRFGIDITPWKDAFNFKKWTWDEHNIKALLPFICKMISFGITAAGALTLNPYDIGGLIYTFYDEANKSGGILHDETWTITSSYWEGVSLIQDSTKEGWDGILQNGKISFNPKGFGLHVFANMLNEYADKQLENLGKYDDWVAPTFDAKEWQIKLSTYSLECSPASDSYSVGVSSRAAWKIEDSGASWCHVSRSGNNIVVSVDDYDGFETRSCQVKVSTIEYKEEIPPATLCIYQTGVIFRLSAPELVFNQEGGEQTVSVTANGNVKTWKVTSKPSWCKVKSDWENALTVIVEKNKHLTEDREGMIVATAQLKSGGTIDRTLIVRQIVEDIWDGTKWNFHGSVNTSSNLPLYGGFNISQVSDFGIEIIDVNQNNYKLSGDLAESKSKSQISTDNQGRLVWTYKETYSESGMTLETIITILFTRTGPDDALAELRGNVYANSSTELGKINFDFNGSFIGKRTD